MPAPAEHAHTYADLASSFGLWGEYIDPDGTFSEEEFDAMGYEGRIAFLNREFGPREEEPEQDGQEQIYGACHH